MHHGTKPQAEVSTLTAHDGDTVITYDPVEAKHEALVWDGNLFARECAGGGWVLIKKGTTEACELATAEYA